MLEACILWRRSGLKLDRPPQSPLALTPVASDPTAVDPFEVARAELVEALACMVNCAIEHDKTEARTAICFIAVMRAILAEAARMDDFLEDLDAAERALLLYLLT